MLEKICEWDRAYTAGFRHTNHAIPEIHFFLVSLVQTVEKSGNTYISNHYFIHMKERNHLTLVNLSIRK